jgi:hypothetical protein
VEKDQKRWGNQNYGIFSTTCVLPFHWHDILDSPDSLCFSQNIILVYSKCKLKCVFDYYHKDCLILITILDN